VVIEVSDVGSETIVVAGKPTLRYVTACLTLFNQGRGKVLLRARGKSIMNCVATVELLRRSFVKGLEIEGISIGSDERTMEDGKKRYISYSEILVNK